MRQLYLLLVIAFALAGPAFGATVLQDNFDGENGGIPTPDYSSFANFEIPGPSPVGLVDTGTLGLPGHGLAVQLGGLGHAAGGIETTNAFSFTAGELIILSLKVAGQQRPEPTRPISVDFFFDAPVDISEYGENIGGAQYRGPSAAFQVGQFALSTDWFYPAGIPNDLPFVTLTDWVVPATSGAFRVAIFGDAVDEPGPLIDDFILSVGDAIPEPSTWFMLVTGVGLIGLVARRKSATEA